MKDSHLHDAALVTAQDAQKGSRVSAAGETSSKGRQGPSSSSQQPRRSTEASPQGGAVAAAPTHTLRQPSAAQTRCSTGSDTESFAGAATGREARSAQRSAAGSMGAPAGLSPRKRKRDIEDADVSSSSHAACRHPLAARASPRPAEHDKDISCSDTSRQSHSTSAPQVATLCFSLDSCSSHAVFLGYVLPKLGGQCGGSVVPWSYPGLCNRVVVFGGPTRVDAADHVHSCVAASWLYFVCICSLAAQWICILHMYTLGDSFCCPQRCSASSLLCRDQSDRFWWIRRTLTPPLHPQQTARGLLQHSSKTMMTARSTLPEVPFRPVALLGS